MTSAGPVIDRLLTLDIETVLIVGVHSGKEAAPLITAGKTVTGVDLLPPYRFDYTHIRGSFEGTDFHGQFDAALSCHTLEHSPDPGIVLRKLRQVVRPDGWLGLVVPGYPQSEFFVGHLTLWTPALLIYHLVHAGWDCSRARYYTTPDRKDIGLLVQNRPAALSGLGWDAQVSLQAYVPVRFQHKMDAWLPDRWDEPTS